ncbi:transmembrane 220 family protein [Aurantimonas sp. C2-6-R+9]|uniref:transmembrane 220 family protein n=1 Tax=unclassified Aurantimonas TaxID=2638230 RepID=UPI002E19A98C|nr:MULTISPECIES: transmembrane 220 family protein [unclassified Aurantimonas]MEC5292277.1 transmembrane 220 family protein [Aurantimonas sp. C2-3-R2]MEC5382492.1 transmembrane 220 family protein [Aurantimonas sp. C2-6-R+9]MEC5413362.1 transmembrane 220 family protein [Aurantimonas sp. C2-4-R8]
MRVINGVFCVILVLFVAVQYNDPDAPLWMLMYGVAAFWCGAAAFRPFWLAHSPARELLASSVVIGLALMVWYWPETPGFWKEEVWWNTETAREGMGVMIAFAGVVVAAIPLLKRLRVSRPAH